MSTHIAIDAVAAGTLAWAQGIGPPSDPSDLSFFHAIESRSIRSVTDGPPSHLLGGAGVGPGWRSTYRLYEALTGESAGDLWGTPARDRYKRALVGGDHHVDAGEVFGRVRFSTPTEAVEAAETVREISERGGPNATRAELEPWALDIEKYVYFFERYEPGEELFYSLY
jgi:hypothetical protein